MRRGILFAFAVSVAAILALSVARANPPLAAQTAARATRASALLTPGVASLATTGLHRYEYVFPDGAFYVYDLDHGGRIVQQVDLPGVTGVRGAVVSPRTHILYISHGGNGGHAGTGSLLAYDLLAQRILWDQHYPRGVDAPAISKDGSRIYLPDGAAASDGIWAVINARTGSILATIQGGAGAHNTVVGGSGTRVYLGGRSYPYLDVADTGSNRVIKRVGPLVSGVRPFTVNGRETITYTTATGFLGFQVSSLRTGRVLYTARFGRRFSWNPAGYAPTAPSHGISLSPNERQLWVIDGPNSYVHVFDVSRVPQAPPRRIFDIKLPDPLTGSESDCSYDCTREGWLQHSLNGCLVFVGDSGDVLSSTTFHRVGYLPALRDTRKFLELDWRGGVPVATSSMHGLGYVTRGPLPPAPRCPKF